jgi:hypothetical protein
MRSSSTSLRSLVMPYRLNPRASVTPPFNQQTLRRLVFVPTTDEIFSAGSLNLAMVGPFPREIPRDPTLQVGFVIDLKSHAASAQFIDSLCLPRLAKLTSPGSRAVRVQVCQVSLTCHRTSISEPLDDEAKSRWIFECEVSRTSPYSDSLLGFHEKLIVWSDREGFVPRVDIANGIGAALCGRMRVGRDLCEQ